MESIPTNCLCTMRTLVTLASLAAAALPLNAQEPLSDRIRAAISNAGGPKPFIANMSNTTAKMAGRMIDDQTQLVAVAALDLVSISYLKLVNIERSEIPSLEAAKSTIAGGNAASVCTAPIARILITEHGAEYRYMVYSKSGEYLFQYSFNAASCTAYMRRR